MGEGATTGEPTGAESTDTLTSWEPVGLKGKESLMVAEPMDGHRFRRFGAGGTGTAEAGVIYPTPDSDGRWTAEDTENGVLGADYPSASAARAVLESSALEERAQLVAALHANPDTPGARNFRLMTGYDARPAAARA